MNDLEFEEIIEKICEGQSAYLCPEEYSRNLMKESDRGCVIFSSELLNDSLKSLLVAYYRKDKDNNIVKKLFSPYSPLSTFESKISICFASYLISTDMYSLLQNIRKMRNKFAHEKGLITFDDSKVRDIYFNLINEKPAKSSGHAPNSKTTNGDIYNRLKFAECVIKLLSRIDVVQQAICLGAPPTKLIERFEG
ncbi:MAG: MltR family transcriptional regulator [Sedimenticola sp.]